MLVVMNLYRGLCPAAGVRTAAKTMIDATVRLIPEVIGGVGQS